MSKETMRNKAGIEKVTSGKWTNPELFACLNRGLAGAKSPEVL
jgi:hypothetical protein